MGAAGSTAGLSDVPFRPAFDCLWCGRHWETRSHGDLEGWAGVCPDCLGRADGNGFIAFRLRAGLADRARAAADGGLPSAAGTAARTAGKAALAAETAGTAAPAAETAVLAPDRAAPPWDEDGMGWAAAQGAAQDDRYTRSGAFARGPVRDLAWQVELDEATTWLDRLPLRGDIVELAAGTGWWSPLLAGKGELSVYDPDEPSLDVARRRLVAHGLRAHLHVRGPWAPPDRAVDAVFAGFWLSRLTDDRMVRFLHLVGAWLRPGGLLAFVDRSGDPEGEAVDDPPVVDGAVRRALPDGRMVRVPQVARTPDALATALARAGFASVDVRATARFFVLGSARRVHSAP